MTRTVRAARLADVARAAGVGTSIASRVLNGDPTVSIRPETRERILEAARRLKYRPNALARGLRLQRTMSLGLVINLAYYYENAEVLTAVERAAAAAGYVTLIADAGDFASQGEAYRRLLYERRVDGLLIATVLVSDAFVGELHEQGFPFVVLNRRVRNGGPSVSVEDALGMQAAVEHLAGLGHRRIAYLAGPVATDPARRRLEGFRAGMHAAGLRVPAGGVRECSLEDRNVFETTRELVSERSGPTALAVWSPTAAVPALAAIKAAGLHVPGDLSIVAYNDSSIASYLDPPLTTVHMPLEEMSRAAVGSLLSIVGGSRPESLVVETPPALVRRASTGPPRA